MNVKNQKTPTEYIVFQCTKCNQYTYAKTIQKGKKCVRCGRNHIVANLKGDIVSSPNQAMKLVKKLQNEAYSVNRFRSTKKSIPLTLTDPLTGAPLPKLPQTNSQLDKLLRKIVEWQQNEQISALEGFPEYIVEYIAQEIEPDPTQRTVLIRKLHKLERITRLTNGNVVVDSS